jgi:hypothetical protein
MGRASAFVRFAASLAGAALALALLVSGLTATAIAQRVVPETPRISPGAPGGGGSSGVGGGAGLLAPTPGLNTTMPSLKPAPMPTPPAAAAPAAPARVVRFRCEVAPNDQSCRKSGAGEDGGGGDEECSCARDYCHTTEAGTRVCEKLQ